MPNQFSREKRLFYIHIPLALILLFFACTQLRRDEEFDGSEDGDDEALVGGGSAAVRSRAHRLPGVRSGEFADERLQVTLVRATCVAMSPTARTFVAAATDGIQVYTLDETTHFDPFDLDLSITPDEAEKLTAYVL